MILFILYFLTVDLHVYYFQIWLNFMRQRLLQIPLIKYTAKHITITVYYFNSSLWFKILYQLYT